MGVDFLDFAWRIEKRLQIPVRPKDLFLGDHTTVGEIFELLWQRLQGLEFEEDLELVRLYHQLHTRLVPTFAQGMWNWMQGGCRGSGRLDDIIPADRRVDFWDALGRDFSYSLPPLTACTDDVYPHFPEELSPQRQLMQLLRTHLFQRLKWVPMTTRIDSQPPPGNQTLGGPKDFWLWGHWRRDLKSDPPRQAPWTREELLEVVRRELADTLEVDLDEVTLDAELVGDLGMA